MYRLGLGDALETELFWNKKLGSMFNNSTFAHVYSARRQKDVKKKKKKLTD